MTAQNICKLTVSHAACVIAGGFFFYVYTLPDRKTTAQTTVKPISGEPLTIERTKIERDTVNIVTSYPGRGESEIVIVKRDIPEARYWIERVNSVSVVAGYDLARESYLQAMYWRRFGFFSFGAGLSARIGDRIEPGIVAGAIYCW